MDKYINAKSLYNQIAEKEELARQRVIDTPSKLPNGDVNPYAIRYATQLDERTAFKFMLADAPTADVVEVRHAYWRNIQPPDQDNNVQCWCSACGAGELHAVDMIVPYCWKCGAKMDEVKE